MNGLRLSVLLCAAQINCPHNNADTRRQSQGRIACSIYLKCSANPSLMQMVKKSVPYPTWPSKPAKCSLASPAWHSWDLAKRLS